MKEIYHNVKNSLIHLEVLEDVFNDELNYKPSEKLDYQIFHHNNEQLKEILNKLQLPEELYRQKGRQMILADIIEYIFFGRGYYAIKSKEEKEEFVKGLLRFVNLLMSYDTMTVSHNLRSKFLLELSKQISEIKNETLFNDLLLWEKSVGLPNGQSEAIDALNNYFDTILPKTAGGLWHELLVYSFLLKSDVGYIIPLLLNQRIIGQKNHIVPPDFLIISYDKRIYGIEVGIKKEIQSGAFSLKTAIPTATIDTLNSRTSDRCPICHHWIPFCDYVIEKYSKFEKIIDKSNFEVRCLEECNIYSREAMLKGECPYMKYSRKKAQRKDFTQHEYAKGYHYHYQCVLNSVPEEMRTKIIAAEDSVALKTHYPYYVGIEELINKR